MPQPTSRSSVALLMLGAVLAVAGADAALAQVRCYRTTCIVWPDGFRVCERVPVDCSTISLQ